MSLATPGAAASPALERSRLSLPALDPGGRPIEVIPPSPCTAACPAGVNVKAYVSLIAEGRFAEALAVVRRRCPLPGICGRICHRPCETACLRGEHDEPIAIRALKRFVADVEEQAPDPGAPPLAPDAVRVAVVGSGPAGLTAAWDLRRAGYRVTVFEARAKPGGMLRYGIAPYRLPREVLDREIELLTSAGIDLRTGHRLGADFDLDELRERGHAAVLLALGAQTGRGLGLAGEGEAQGVEDALAFLGRTHAGDRERLSGRVAVIGGGSTAVEAARTARRLGAEAVEIVYRRTRRELLAENEEIAAAEAEGIRFRFLLAPAALQLDGATVRGLRCRPMALGEPDASGRRRPVPIAGDEILVPADRILAAVGQLADLGGVPEGLRANGRLRVDPATSRTAAGDVFAAGDVAGGPATVIDAIAAGHQAAGAIREFLERPRARGRSGQATPIEFGLPPAAPPFAARRHAETRALDAGAEFLETELAFESAEAIAEARRCLRCGPCSECRICAPSCPHRHLLLRPGNGSSETSTLLRAPAAVAAALAARPPAAAPAEVGGSVLPTAVRVRTERCRGCALCVEVCPFDAVRVDGEDAAAPVARVAPALCRGCNLCLAACPTEAMVSDAFPGSWWRERLERIAPAGASPAIVVFACRRRAASVGRQVAGRATVEVIPVRCAGALTAGRLLEAYARGARGVLVAGCLPGRCRYGAGAKLAADEADQAQSILRLLGGEADRILADWSGEPGQDPLDEALVGLISGLATGPRRLPKEAGI